MVYPQSLIQANLYEYSCFALCNEKNFSFHQMLEQEFNTSKVAAVLGKRIHYSEQAIRTCDFNIPSMRNHFKFLCDLYFNEFGDHPILVDIFLTTNPMDIIRLYRILNAMILDLSRSISSAYTSELYCFSGELDSDVDLDTPLFSSIDLNYSPTQVLNVTNINHFGLVLYGEVDSLIDLDLRNICHHYQQVVVNLIEYLAYGLNCPIDIPQFECLDFSITDIIHLSDDVEVRQFLNYIIGSDVEYKYLEAFYSNDNISVELLKSLLLEIQYRRDLDDLMLNELSKKLFVHLCLQRNEFSDSRVNDCPLAVVIEHIGILNLRKIASPHKQHQFKSINTVKNKYLKLHEPITPTEIQLYSFLTSIFDYLHDEDFVRNKTQFAEITERVVTNVIFSNDNPVRRTNESLERKLYRSDMESGAIYINGSGLDVSNSIKSLAFAQVILNKLAVILSIN